MTYSRPTLHSPSLPVIKYACIRPDTVTHAISAGKDGGSLNLKLPGRSRGVSRPTLFLREMPHEMPHETMFRGSIYGRFSKRARNTRCLVGNLGHQPQHPDG